MRILLLHHPYVYPRFEQDFLERVNERAEFHVVCADLPALSEGRLAGQTPLPALTAYDAIIVFVAFNALRRARQLDWQGYSGLRLLFDHDVIQNYSDIFDPRLKGLWVGEFRRHRFDAIVTSGNRVRLKLADDGILADWLPKAFEPARFVDREEPRAGIVTYGSLYRCREVAERALAEARIALTRLAMTPYPDLGGVLSGFLAGLAVSSDLPIPLAQRGWLRAIPARQIPMQPGLEPMAKFFELAGAGCCPVSDAMEDLGALGFSDGLNAVTFSSHADLVERMGTWLKKPEALRELGRAAARLAHERHTWRHRAAELSALVARRITGGGVQRGTMASL